MVLPLSRQILSISRFICSRVSASSAPNGSSIKISLGSRNDGFNDERRRQWLGARLAASFPLHLLSNQPAFRLHSQLDPAKANRAGKVGGREPIVIHPDDAMSRNIGDGDVVRVFNDHGAFLARAVISASLVPGVVQIATGAWYDPLEPGKPGSLEKHGNPNVVTLDKGASRLSQGSVAQTALVEIEKYSLAPPEVTAFDRPAIVGSAC